MESEKAKEIKKVLEEVQFNTIDHHQKEGKPIKISFADILTLINELESENKRLKRSINSIQRGFDNGEFISKDCKTSGLKHFAERLKESAQKNLDHFMGFQKVVLVEQIDELLEEYKND